MAAAQYGNLEIVKALLEKGADIHFKNSTGMTALSYAITSKQKAVEQLLIQAGATE
ncbi:MAG: ankyrin repeat domain-containing protein [Thermodesulfobacteriota bacterium]